MSNSADLDGYPVLRIDQITNIDSKVLRKAEPDVIILLESIKNDKSQEKLMYYLQRQIEAMKNELVKRAANDRVQAMLMGTEEVFIDYNKINEDKNKNLTPRVKPPKRNSSAASDKSSNITPVPIPIPIKAFKPILTPSEILRQQQLNNPPKPIAIKDNNSSLLSIDANESESSASLSSIIDNNLSNHDFSPSPLSSSSVNKIFVSSTPPSTSTSGILDSDTIKTKRRPKSSSASTSVSVIDCHRKPQNFDISQNFGSQFVVAATEKKKRFYPKKKQVESQEEIKLKEMQESRKIAMKRLLERREKQQELQNIAKINRRKKQLEKKKNIQNQVNSDIPVYKNGNKVIDNGIIESESSDEESISGGENETSLTIDPNIILVVDKEIENEIIEKNEKKKKIVSLSNKSINEHSNRKLIVSEKINKNFTNNSSIDKIDVNQNVKKVEVKTSINTNSKELDNITLQNNEKDINVLEPSKVSSPINTSISRNKIPSLLNRSIDSKIPRLSNSISIETSDEKSEYNIINKIKQENTTKNKVDTNTIQILKSQSEIKNDLINNDFIEIVQIENKIDDDNDHKNNIITNIDLNDDDADNNSNNKFVPVIIADKDITEPIKFALSGDIAVKNFSALDMIRQMKLKKAKQLEEQSLIQEKSQQVVEIDNSQQQKVEFESELKHQQQEKSLSALDSIRQMKLRKDKKLEKVSQIIEKSKIESLGDDVSKLEISKQIIVKDIQPLEEIENVDDDNDNIEDGNCDDNIDDDNESYDKEEKLQSFNEEPEIIQIVKEIDIVDDDDNDGIENYKSPVIIVDKQIERGKNSAAKQIRNNVLESIDNSKEEECDNENMELNISNRSINSNHNNGTLIMISEDHGEIYYVCSLGPDELPGLRAWTLSGFEKKKDSNNIKVAKWDLNLNAYLEPLDEDPLAMELFIQREDTRHLCSYGLIVLVQDCEELLTGVKFARTEVEFIKLWENCIRNFDDKVNNMPENKSKKLFENVTVCGNCHLVCKKVENLLKTKFMMKSSKSMKDLNSESLISSSYVIGNSFSTDQIIQLFPQDNNDNTDDNNSQVIVKEKNENVLSETNVISKSIENNIINISHREKESNTVDNDDNEIEIKIDERLFVDGSDVESITCDGMEDDDDDDDDDEPILPSYSIKKSKDFEMAQVKIAIVSPIKNQVKNNLIPELTPLQKKNLELINIEKIRMEGVIEQIVTEEVAEDKKGRKIKSNKATKLSDIFTHIGMIFPAAYTGTGGTKGTTDGISAGRTLIESMQIHGKLYDEWLEVMSDYATVFSRDKGNIPENSTQTLSSSVYNGGTSGLHYKVKSTRPEVYNIVTDVFNQYLTHWEELPAGLGLGVSWNLLWSWSKPRINMSHLLVCQKVNHFNDSKQLTRKDMLKKNLQRYTDMKGKFAEEFEVMPQTYTLPHEYTQFVKAFTDIENEKNSRCIENVWIMKPVGMSRGRGISLVRDIASLTYSQTSVVQRYIEKPLCLNGYKFDLRIYVLVTSFKPLEVFIYKEGFARVSTHQYSMDLNKMDDLFIHLTNSSIQKLNTSGPTRDNPLSEELGGSKLPFFGRTGLWKRLEDSGVNVDLLWKNICTVVLKALVVVDDKMVHQPCCFEVFGYDVLIDASLRSWLIEVNASPSMSRDNQLDYLVKDAMIRDTISIIDPLPYDRSAVAKILKKRLAEILKNKSITTKNDPELDKDLQEIFGNKIPRQYGEMPQVLGDYQRLCPNTKIYNNIIKLKSKIIKSDMPIR